MRFCNLSLEDDLSLFMLTCIISTNKSQLRCQS